MPRGLRIGFAATTAASYELICLPGTFTYAGQTVNLIYSNAPTPTPGLAVTATARSEGTYLLQPSLKERTTALGTYRHETSGVNNSGLYSAAPSYYAVDELCDWLWTNPGGDWIDASGVPQGSNHHVSFAMNSGSFTIYSVPVTALLQWIYTNDWWNAWYIGRGASTSRTIGGLHNTDPAKRPSISVTYTDGTTATLACRITSIRSTGSNSPASFAETLPLPCFAEFERPTKPVLTATLSLYGDFQWSGTQPITIDPLNPPKTTAGLAAGIAAAYPQDAGLAAAPGVWYAHNLADGTPESAVISPILSNMLDSVDLDPKLHNDALPADTSKLPHTAVGKWINAAYPLATDPTLSLVPSTYTGEGFVPLAPGLGALHCKIRKFVGLADGVRTDSSGQTGAIARMYLPFDEMGEADHGRMRFYVRVHWEQDPTWAQRYICPNTDNLAQATNYSGKFGPGWLHDTSEFGFSGGSGSGGGWQWRKQWVKHVHGVEGPGEGAMALGTHIKSDFIGNSPISYATMRENWGDNGGFGGAVRSDTWYLIEDEFILNTMTDSGLGFVADGIYRVWMAPVGQTPQLVHERTGLAIRSKPVHRGSIGLPVLVPGAGNVGSVTFANNMGMLAASTPTKAGPNTSAFSVTLNMGNPFAPGFAIAETITLTFDGTGGYTVSGSVHGAYAPGTVGVAYVSANRHKWTVTGAPVLGNTASISFVAQPYSPGAAIPETIVLTFDGAGGYTAVGSFYGAYPAGTVGVAYETPRRHKWEIGGTPAAGDTLTITYPQGAMAGGRTAIRNLGIRDVMINMFHGGKTETPFDIDWFIAGFAMGDGKVMAGPFGPMAGLVPTAQITGSAWTPNRDVDDAVLLSDFAQLPANTWLTVSGTANKLRDVAESPTLSSSGGGDSFTGVVQAWSGAAWDADREAMLITGGGHTDTSARDTAVFEVNADTLRVARVVNRQAAGTPIKPTLPATSQANWVAATPGEHWMGGMNYPLSTGVPSSNHTAGMIEWLPPAAMAALGLAAPVRGGMFLGGMAQAVVNLDTGAYTQCHFVVAGYPAGNVTMGSESSLAHWMRDPYSSKLLGIRGGSSPWMTFDLAQTEMTLWQLMPQCTTPAVPSFGKFLPNKSNSACSTLPTWSLIVKLRERREMVFFQANQADYTAKRVRFGQGVDAGAADLAAYTDSITLSSDNGTDHLDFSAANFKGYYGHNLNHAGSFFDAVDGCIWICANDPWQGSYDPGGNTFTPGSSHPLTVYKITGATTGSLADSAWKVKKFAGAQPLTISTSGTWGRFAVVHRGAERIGMRISGVDNPIEIIRLT